MGEITVAVILLIISVACFVFSFFQFREKGFLFNNAYIHATKQEREAMVKTPYYRQSGVAFALVGLIFLLSAVDAVMNTDWLVFAKVAVALTAIVYAVVSTVKIEKKK